MGPKTHYEFNLCKQNITNVFSGKYIPAGKITTKSLPFLLPSFLLLVPDPHRGKLSVVFQ